MQYEVGGTPHLYYPNVGEVADCCMCYAGCPLPMVVCWLSHVQYGMPIEVILHGT